MAIDMSQFFQVFFEEAAEHLANMEALLLAIDPAAPDPEEINALFRAAHSIKGSSGTFGFQDMMEVTHVLETMLDRVRKGEAALTGEMVDASLVAGDVLNNLLAAHRGEGVADRAAAEAISHRLEALCRALDKEAAGQPLPETSALSSDSDDYGFFDEPAPPPAEPAVEAGADDAYGFFGDLPHVEVAYGFFEEPAKAEEAWGLFAEEPAPTSVSVEPAAAAPVDESFGFFEPLPPVVAEPAAAMPVALVPKEKPVAVPAQKPAAARPGAGETGSIRVGVDKVDQMINLVGELVITQAMLTQAMSQLDPAVSERLMQGLTQLERNTRDLQESVMSIRMMPISVVFSRFPRVVRDLSQKLGKQVELKTSGETTELDKGLIERITDPLTHLIRNSLDHGIETPERRREAGKSECGTITLKAYHQSGNIVIEVGDDGAGLNRSRILSKARERGLAVHDTMTDQDVWQLIFEPGFSTADQVTEVSGRGVGMDVVKRNISAMGGRIEMESMAGIGTRITVRLPLTLAILDGMSVGVGAETYIIPLGYVVESLQPEAGMMKSIAGQERLVQVRGEYLPVVCLHEMFNIQNAVTDWARGIMLVLEADGQKAALFLDQLIGQHQVVIKSLEANYRRVQGIAGATIMGDGRVALILDIAALVGMARHQLPVAA